MKAFLDNCTLCPACEHLMLYSREDHTIRCIWAACELSGIKYHAPSVELEPVDKPSRVEYVICQVEIDEVE